MKFTVIFAFLFGVAFAYTTIKVNEYGEVLHKSKIGTAVVRAKVGANEAAKKTFTFPEVSKNIFFKESKLK